MDLQSDIDKSKAPRWNIKPAALTVLEQIFTLEKFPSQHIRQRLAYDLAVTARQARRRPPHPGRRRRCCGGCALRGSAKAL